MHFRPQPVTPLAHPVRRLAAGDDRVAVTGAAGWFGRVTLDLLGRSMGSAGFRARVAGYASRARTVEVAGVGPVALRPLAELEPAEVLLHFAFLTRGRVAPDDHDAFVAANIAISSRVLQVIDTDRVRRVFVTSSGAARHTDLARNPYGALKRLDELAFSAACREAGATCVLARVFNVGGSHMTHPEAYALGDLILRARAGLPLVISARGEVLRSYVAVEDVLAVALGELVAGRDAFFDAAGERAVEIEELARLVLTVLGRPELAVVRERDPSAVANIYLGDGSRLRELAREHNVTLQDLEAMVAATAAGFS